jgi:hypothetical protein
LGHQRQVIGIIVRHISLAIAVDRCKGAAARAIGHHLEAIAVAGRKAIDQADIERSIECGAAANGEPVIMCAGGEAAEFDVERGCRCLCIIARNRQDARGAYTTRIDLAAMIDDIALNSANTRQTAAFQVKRGPTACGESTTVQDGGAARLAVNCKESEA